MAGNLRKSLPKLNELTNAKLREIFSSDAFVAPITEKTDGFAFEIGSDSEGFFARSASSPKIRKMGDFSRYCYSKYAFEPSKIEIPLRLELAFHVLHSRDTLVRWLREKRMTIQGEMFLVVDGKVFSPRGTQYDKVTDFHTERLGIFVIHTRMNPLLSHRDVTMLTSIIRLGDLDVDVDIPIRAPSWLNLQIDDLRERWAAGNTTSAVLELEKRIRNQLNPFSSNWSNRGAEGFVVHYSEDIRFKIMRNV